MTSRSKAGAAAAHSSSSASTRPVVLIIRDGWGRNPNPEHDSFNAIKLARTPIDDRLVAEWPNTLIVTCGEDVGLPPGTMGNSEVGHQNIGAGRIVDQELMRITRSIRDGSFFKNAAFLAAIKHAFKTGGSLHLLGLVSNGQVHSDIEHLFALIDLAAQQRFPAERLFVHAITDGRDVGPFTGLGFIKQLEAKLDTYPQTASPGRARFAPRIATVIGRYYAMDRDNRWDRVAQAYAALTAGDVCHPALPRGFQPQRQASAVSAVRSYYDHPSEPSRAGDEFIIPTQIVDPATNAPIGVVSDNDAVIFFNFRGDRPREITKAFVLSDAEWRKVPNAIASDSGGGGGFDRGPRIENLFFCTMTAYEEGLPVSAVAFHKPPKMKDILGEVIANAGLTQFRCAETEKFPHVTFFFNDYREEPFPGEHRELIPSPKDVTTYDQKPQMSAPGVCDAVLRRLAAPDCEPLLIVNFANPDMVGHTGKLDAAIKAVEVVDECVGRIVDATLARGGSLIVTADHGNAEQMWDPINNCPHTAHTSYDVPLILIGEPFRRLRLREGGRLADIAPTLLTMLGMQPPTEMTGLALLDRAISDEEFESATARFNQRFGRMMKRLAE
ncbi:MAG: 2,3-bisphosphoglycerate-independent phosphoglycerate mutase [Phycisphaerales bacterium]|nr:2,3-bisphosphoglycerate-independent phosphoglycerate mutase [Phycisphaerales bacterium]